MSEFMQELRAREGIGARALEFTIYCAARSGEVRGALWSEVDFESAVWTVPPERMKAKREHRVPLSASALSLLRRLPRGSDSDLVFASNKGGLLSDMTLTLLLRRMQVDAVPHGFRSTFRDWVGELTSYPRELAEQALAHVVENKVEAAYRRGDALEKRRKMMAEWASFCDGSGLPGVRSAS
jgi:integrase